MEKYSESYMIEHMNEYETMEYANLENEKDYYKTIFNGKFSYNDIEANSKDGWIRVYIINQYDQKTKNPYFEPYIIYKKNKPEIAKTKLFGKVIIFKVDKKTGEFIKKRK